MIGEERRLQQLKCWELTTLKMLIEVFVKQSGEMNEEQYEITGIAQPETVRHKRDLWTVIELSL